MGAFDENFQGMKSASLALAIISPFLLTWYITSWRSWRAIDAAMRASPGQKRPPTLPSAIPIIGHVLDFMRDGHSFLSNAVYVQSFFLTISYVSYYEDINGISNG